MTVHVISASRHGSTAGIGAAIAERLTAAGHEVVWQDAETAELPPNHEPVVLGSPIYMGKWLKPARDLLDQLGAEPPGRLIFCFSVGPVGDPPKPVDSTAEEEVETFVADRAAASRTFSGRLDRSQLGRLERMVVATIGASSGDFREWDDITAWADEIDRCLDAAATAPGTRAA